MEIYNIDITEETLDLYQNIVNECQEIINENLQVNGGILKQADIFKKDFDWTNLIIAISEEKVVGFALLRLSPNVHNLKMLNNYYYLSDIVVKNEYKQRGVAIALMKSVISKKKEMPLIASVLKENQASIKLLSKFMKCYGISKKGKYLRFVDNEYYNILYGGEISENLVSNETVSSKRHI